MQFVGNHKSDIHWPSRLRACAVHLAISLVIAVLAAVLVFWLWYPFPYRELAGGRELFVLVVAVDVVLGPLLTLAIFDRSKTRRQLAVDLSFVGLLQLAALGYGLWTVAVARPVHLVFEIDRFRVVHRIDIADELLDRAPPELRTIPLVGTSVLSVRPFKDSGEKMEATFAALAGADLAARPDLWEPYEAAKPRVRVEARPVSQLLTRFPEETSMIREQVRAAGLDPMTALYLPLAARKSFGTVVLDPASLDVVTFLSVDSF